MTRQAIGAQGTSSTFRVDLGRSTTTVSLVLISLLTVRKVMHALDRGAHHAEVPISCPLSLRERAGVRVPRDCERPRQFPLTLTLSRRERGPPPTSSQRRATSGVQGRGHRRPACISFLTLK